MLKHTGLPGTSPTQRQRRLAFLAAFLDDDTVRDTASNPEMFRGFAAGRLFDRLEVRNFAAMQMAAILGTPVDPTPEWKAKEWTEVRNRVRAAVVASGR